MAVPPQLLDHAAERFRLLGDPSRLRLLNALDEQGELAAGALAERAGLTASNASRHLALLEGAGLVARRREGTTIHYRIADPSLHALCEAACTGVRARLAGLADAAGAGV